MTGISSANASPMLDTWRDRSQVTGHLFVSDTRSPPPPAVHRRLPRHARSGPEQEAIVALRRDVVAPLPIAPDATWVEVGQEGARLVSDVGSHVPRVGFRHQRRVDDRSDMRRPLLFRLRRRFDRLQLVPADVISCLTLKVCVSSIADPSIPTSGW